MKTKLEEPSATSIQTDQSTRCPECFGVLEIVFPMGSEGLRITPEGCMACQHKTECLRSAMQGKSGTQVREELLNRAHKSGLVGFLERWSRKKTLAREREL